MDSQKIFDLGSSLATLYPLRNVWWGVDIGLFKKVNDL